jgi:hypothetical protein
LARRVQSRRERERIPVRRRITREREKGITLEGQDQGESRAYWHRPSPTQSTSTGGGYYCAASMESHFK